MKLIPPVLVTDASLTASNVAESGYAEWSAGTTYAVGDRVSKVATHRVYESASSANIGNDPAATGSTQWVDVGATNRWAMFDRAVGAPTAAAGSIAVSLAPGVPVDTLALLNVLASTARVVVTIAGTVVFDQTQGANTGLPVCFFGLPANPFAHIAVTVSGGAQVMVGTLIIGTAFDLGLTETGPTISITDFSARDTDAFGVTTVTERAWSKKVAVRLQVPSDDVDELQRRLVAVRAKPVLWIGEDGFESLTTYGFYSDYSTDLQLNSVSYSSLTITSLPAEDPDSLDGPDPAPPGSASSLLVVRPHDVTDATLIASTIPETDYPAWSASVSYATGARVIEVSSHRIYESLIDANAGHDPAGDAGVRWLDVGPTNRWAMFDQALGTDSTGTGEIVMTFAASEALSAIAVLDTDASSVRVVAPGYDQTKAPAADGSSALTFLDLDVDAGSSITVTISAAGAGAPVSVGTLMLGDLWPLGITEISPTLSITDYSLKTTDDFGNTTVVERSWAKGAALKSLVASDAVDGVLRRIASIRARPCLWIGQEGVDSLAIYGFYKDFTVTLAPNVSVCGATIEGLSTAAPIVPFTIPWEDVTDPQGTKPDDNATNSADPSSPLGAGTVGHALSDIDSAKSDVATALASIEDLFDTYGDTASASASAAAAAAAANAAQTARDLAATAQSDAQAARDAAQTAQADALNSANLAGASESSAAGFASSAAGSASEAGTSATAADISATSASGSANTATIQAGYAGNSAASAASSASGAAANSSAAGTSASAAEQSNLQATVTAGNLLPSDFQQDGRFWTEDYGGFTPAINPTYLPHAVFATAAAGRVLSTDGSVEIYGSIGYFTFKPTHTYRITARSVITRDPTNTAAESRLWVGLSLFDGSQAYIGIYWVANPVASVATFYVNASGTATTEDIVAAHPTAVFGRPIFYHNWVNDPSIGYNGNGKTLTLYCKAEDVTSEAAAAGSASASAASASTASASETAAGFSASAAHTSELNASTEAALASVSAGEAASSSTSAAGSAGTAATYSNLAGGAASTAGGSASAAASSASVASGAADAAGASATSATTAANTASGHASDAAFYAASSSGSAAAASGYASAAQSSATLSAAYNRPRANLLVNGSGENGMTGITGAITGWITGTNVWGSVFEASTLSGATNSINWPPFPVIPNETYTVSADPLLYATAGSAYVDIQFLRSDGSTTKDGTQNARSAPFNFADDSSGKDAIAVSDTAPSDAVTGIARFVWTGISGLTVIGVRQMKVEHGALPWTGYDQSLADAYGSLASVSEVANVAATAAASLASRADTLEAQMNGTSGSSLKSTIDNNATVASDATQTVANNLSSMSSMVAGLSATVSVQAGTLATVQGRTAAFWQVTAVAGGRAQLTVLADANGGGGVDIGGDLSITGDVVVDGSLTVKKLLRADLSSFNTDVDSSVFRVYGVGHAGVHPSFLISLPNADCTKESAVEVILHTSLVSQIPVGGQPVYDGAFTLRVVYPNGAYQEKPIGSWSERFMKFMIPAGQGVGTVSVQAVVYNGNTNVTNGSGTPADPYVQFVSVDGQISYLDAEATWRFIA